MIAMAIMIVTSILSLRGLPSEAKFGVQSIFYYILAAVVFLVPFSLVCAELAATFNSFRGQKMANKLSTLGGLWGTIIPGALLIVLGVIYFFSGKPVMLTPMPFFPNFSHLSTVVLAASIFLFYGGMEIQAVHINDMNNPARQFPRSVLIAVVVIVVVYCLGTLVIGEVISTVESAYQIMSQMATIIYLIMVLMIYGAFLRLQRTQPNKQRGFRVPGGNVGKWVVTILGMGGALLALVLSYLPPSQITTGSPVVYIGILLLGVAVFVALPLIVYALRKPSWRNPDAHFYPFDWQIEGRKPWEVSKWKPGYVPTEQEVDDAETDAIAKHASAPHI